MEQNQYISNAVSPRNSLSAPLVQDLVNRPIPDQDFGTVHDLLLRAIGQYVVCELLIGSQIVTREGRLAHVGSDFFLLYNNAEDTATSCDLYSLKFITFYPANMPMPLPASEPMTIEGTVDLPPSHRNEPQVGMLERGLPQEWRLNR